MRVSPPDPDHVTAPEAPLGGIRVLDFTHAAAGPYLTMLLADLGAEVIKIEKPRGGDGSRSMGEPMHGHRNSDYYLSINRNKRGIVLDLGVPRGREMARGLAAKCDVIVQNFRPGVMDRLGLGFDDLRRVREHLVYCSLSAFGSTGPWSTRPANDIIMQSVSGMMSVTGEPDGGPVKFGVPIADYGTGLFGLGGVLAALYARSRHPQGQHVEVAMLNASLALTANHTPRVVTLGRKARRMGRQHPQIVPYQAFRCADGEYVMIGAFTSEFWRRLCRALDHPEWIVDERYRYNSRRLENRDQLIAELDEIFAAEPRSHWLDVMAVADVPASPVFDIADAYASEQARHNQAVHHLTEGDRVLDAVASPIRSPQWPRSTATMPPRLGEHTREVVAELLALDADELERLTRDGVIGTHDAENAMDDTGGAR